MTPKGVFDVACLASKTKDKDLALRVCDLVVKMDLFFGQRTPKTGAFQIVTTHRDKPCQGCGETIPSGTAVKWLPGYGCWHPDCPTDG